MKSSASLRLAKQSVLREAARPMFAWLPVRNLADAMAPKLAGILVDSVKAGRKVFVLSDVEKAIESGLPTVVEAALTPTILAMIGVWEKRIPTLILDTFESAATTAGRSISVDPNFRAFDRKPSKPAKPTYKYVKGTPEGVAWAKKHSAELINKISDDTRLMLRRTIQKGYADGTAPTKLARQIETIIGLDPKRAQAVENLRNKILNSPGKTVYAGNRTLNVPKTPEKLEGFARREAQRYAEKLLRERAIVIAKTESIRIANAGQREAWKQAAKKGVIDSAQMERYWIVTHDDRLCPQCAGYEGDTAPIGGLFSISGLDGPPAHPLCRCAQGIREIKRKRKAA